MATGNFNLPTSAVPQSNGAADMKLAKFTLLVLTMSLAGCAIGPQTQLERERERLQVRLWEQCMKVNSEKHKQNFDAAAYFDACYNWSRSQSKPSFPGRLTRKPIL